MAEQDEKLFTVERNCGVNKDRNAYKGETVSSKEMTASVQKKLVEVGALVPVK
jgi:hypothetical protein